MMNQTEFTEYATVLLADHTIQFFHEEGDEGYFNADKKQELVDNVFDVESSALVIYKDQEIVGRLYLNMDNSKAKGVYVEINNHSDNEATAALVQLADKYYPQ